MGTIHNQPPRNFRHISKTEVNEFLNDVDYLTRTTGFKTDQILTAYHILELRRRNDLYVDHGDAFDEQLSGIAQIIEGR